jgi:hypothetical protein
MSLHSALRLLRGARAAETADAEATPDSAERSGPLAGDQVSPSTRPRSRPFAPSDLPSAEDDEAARWAKLVALRTGSGMGSVIWDPTRPRNLDRGDTRALVRDNADRSVWRE